MGVSNEQLYLALAAPLLSSAVTVAILVAYINSQIGALRSDINQRFDDMRDLWRAELRRVEEVLDQRLRNLER